MVRKRRACARKSHSSAQALYRGDGMLCGGVPRKYMAQCQGAMGVCGFPRNIFVAACYAERKLTVVEIDFCPAYWDALEVGAVPFA